MAIASALGLGPALLFPQAFTWLVGGMVIGAGLMTLLIVWDLPPQAIEDWGRGAEAEQMTERVLEPLHAEGWRTKHDLQFRGGNIDHLVHGPGGTFLLETKSPRGRASVVGGMLITHPIDDPEKRQRWAVLAQLERQMAAVREGSVPGVKRVNNIQPVVVLWGDFPQRICEANGVFFVHGEYLADWLRSRLAPPLTPFPELA